MSSQIVKSDSVLQRIARISLLIYPLIAHIGILMDEVIWSASYLIVVVYFNSLKRFYRQSITGISFTILMCALLYSLFHFQLHASLIYLPPILIPAWLAYVFIRSMGTEHALISKIAERMEGKPLDEQHLRYTRWLTALWGFVFVLMICEAIVLAVWASYEVWSWWVHIGNYFIIAILFLGEMMVRRQLVGHQAQVGQMFRALLQRNWRG
ncbi:MAG: hypothetical protein GQ549_07940 [Gammaproteobacteria bacterium]|nr:hypothetical protein [Gammaproteobacteria bacterium]